MSSWFPPCEKSSLYFCPWAASGEQSLSRGSKFKCHPIPSSVQVTRPKCLKFLQGFGDDVAEPHLLRRKINTPERSDLNEMRRPTLLQAATTVRWWSFQSHVGSHLLKYQQLRGKRGRATWQGALAVQNSGQSTRSNKANVKRATWSL